MNDSELKAQRPRRGLQVCDDRFHIRKSQQSATSIDCERRSRNTAPALTMEEAMAKALRHIRLQKPECRGAAIASIIGPISS